MGNSYYVLNKLFNNNLFLTLVGFFLSYIVSYYFYSKERKEAKVSKELESVIVRLQEENTRLRERLGESDHALPQSSAEKILSIRSIIQKNDAPFSHVFSTLAGATLSAICIGVPIYYFEADIVGFIFVLFVPLFLFNNFIIKFIISGMREANSTAAVKSAVLSQNLDYDELTHLTKWVDNYPFQYFDRSSLRRLIDELVTSKR